MNSFSNYGFVAYFAQLWRCSSFHLFAARFDSRPGSQWGRVPRKLECTSFEESHLWWKQLRVLIEKKEFKKKSLPINLIHSFILKGTWARIFKLLRSPRIDSNSAKLCRNRVVVYDNPIPTRFLAPIDCLKIRAQLSPARNEAVLLLIKIRVKGSCNVTQHLHIHIHMHILYFSDALY